MKILIIDDLRSVDLAIEIATSRCSTFNLYTPDYSVVLAKTYSEACAILNKEEYWDYILLDHDLVGTDIYDDGTKLINLIEERFFEKKINFGEIISISSNPVATRKIKAACSAMELRKGK